MGDGVLVELAIVPELGVQLKRDAGRVGSAFRFTLGPVGCDRGVRAITFGCRPAAPIVLCEVVTAGQFGFGLPDLQQACLLRVNGSSRTQGV
jgi:hypothetical protein